MSFSDAIKTYTLLTVGEGLASQMPALILSTAIVENFSILKPVGLIFTRLDETGYFGTAINVAYRTQLPVLCFTTGQRVPEDIVMAEYEYMAKILLDIISLEGQNGGAGS